MEMTRRLKNSIEGLTAEITGFRTSSDRLATRLLWFTGALVILTVVLVTLTAVLIARS
jgi:hypothetical protein